MFSKTVNSTRESTTLDNLEKYTWYVIKVAGFTSKGLGPPTPRPLEIRTSEDGKSRDLLLFISEVDKSSDASNTWH